ncbi:hypothetical protein ACHQM5_030714 [Ranunculus cassubicifolius]
MNSSNIIQRSVSDASSRGKVKLEISEEEHNHSRPLNKKPKPSSFHIQHNQLWNTGSRSSSQLQPNSVEEPPSPLGLRLRKTPSLLDLIQIRLSHGDQPNPNPNPLGNNDHLPSSGTDKLKASNFPASLLRIGTWEYASHHEGDLVAKCYFAKQKLVWEVLQSGLKSKIEIQWSDIMVLKASYPDDGPGTLDIVLARRPLFFRETNPQPRKHTLWQATSDFTSGQASIHRRHFLQCPHGLLNKHFEKLIQCDPRLNLLSRRPETVSNSPYFEAKGYVFEEPGESRWEELDQLKGDFISTFPGYQDDTPSSAKKQVKSPECSASSTSGKFTEKSEAEDLSKTVECNKFRGGLHASMSMSDLVNHIGHCISEEPNGDTLEEMAQYLLSDSHHHASTSDEKSVMSRVNSFCSLLHKNPCSIQNDCKEELELSDEDTTTPHRPPPPVGGMPRKDSVGDLLPHLPRIASLPHFLFHIAQDSYYQAR